MQLYLFPMDGETDGETEMAPAGPCRPEPITRVIFCLDLNQFYVAVERRRDPSLVGRPVVIGADPKQGRGRGVVAASSYEAREHGVRSAMPISWAWRRCPQAIYLRPDFDAYVEVSRRVMARLTRRARCEPASIDEAYLDVSAETGGAAVDPASRWERARALALDVKRELREEEGLACSIGVAPNKLVAKVASDFQKPDGLTVVRPSEVAAFLAPLEVSVLLGVGPKTRARLNAAGIRTCADLAATPVERLHEVLGWGPEYAQALREEAIGIDDGEVVPDREPRSIGRETTFDEDVGDAEVVLTTVADLADEVHARLIEDGYAFRTVVLKLRYAGFETHTRRKTLKEPSADRDVLAQLARELALPFLEKRRRVRLVGVTAANLSRAADPA